MIDLEILRRSRCPGVDTDWVFEPEFSFLLDEDWLNRYGYDSQFWLRNDRDGVGLASAWRSSVSAGYYPTMMEFAQLPKREQLQFVSEFLLGLSPHEHQHFLANVEVQANSALVLLNFYRQYFNDAQLEGDVWSVKIYHNFYLSFYFLRELNSPTFNLEYNCLKGRRGDLGLRTCQMIHWAMNDGLVYGEFAGRTCVDRLEKCVDAEFVRHADSIRNYLPELDYLL